MADGLWPRRLRRHCRLRLDGLVEAKKISKTSLGSGAGQRVCPPCGSPRGRRGDHSLGGLPGSLRFRHQRTGLPSAGGGAIGHLVPGIGAVGETGDAPCPPGFPRRTWRKSCPRMRSRPWSVWRRRSSVTSSSVPIRNRRFRRWSGASGRGGGRCVGHGHRHREDPHRHRPASTGSSRAKPAVASSFSSIETSLGEQAENAFKESPLENYRTFAQIFELQGLQEKVPQPETKVHIQTVQGMVSRLFKSGGEAGGSSVGLYDCIIVDEAHRGYKLDKEMGEVELLFPGSEGIHQPVPEGPGLLRCDQDWIDRHPGLAHKGDVRRSHLQLYLPGSGGGRLSGRPHPAASVTTRLAKEGIRWQVGESRRGV